jgi:capsular polysaccharide biosynthesis protein
MFFAELPQVLLRRWYLVIVGLLLTGGLAAATFQAVRPTYESTSEVLLLPPATSVPKGGNPYLVLGGLEAIGGVLSTAMMDQATTSEVKTEVPGAEYTIGLDETSPAPMLVVTARATTPQESLRIVDLVLQRIPPTMEKIQRAADVSTGSYITTTQITATERPTVIRKSQLRLVLVAAALGIAFTLLVVALIDALIMRRRAVRRAKSPKHEEGQSSRGAAADDIVTELEGYDGLADAAPARAPSRRPWRRSDPASSGDGDAELSSIGR